MAKTIKELYNEKVWEFDFSPEPSLAFAEGFELGADAVLEEIVKFADSTWLSNSLNTISLKKKVKQLKGE